MPAHKPPPLSPASQFPLRTLTPQAPEHGNGQSEPGLVVSVVVPCKDDARYLSAALESILSQDYPLLECIVVDGGSTDGTTDLLKRYGDRIRWLSEPDRGPFDAINRGWQLSKGEILTWLNADDLWEPGAVRTVVDFFERRPDVDVVYGIARVVDELGQVHGDLVPRTWDLEHALRHCHHVIFQPASFMRRRILERVGWLYPAWCHDHDLWLRIARAGGKFARLPVRLAMDRARPNNRGAQPEIVVPAKLALTRRFFADPGLPPTIRRLQRRAISGACVLAVDYLRIAKPRDWLMAARFLAQAVAVDPASTRLIGQRLTRLFRRCIESLLSGVFKLCSKMLSRGASTCWLPNFTFSEHSRVKRAWVFDGHKQRRFAERRLKFLDLLLPSLSLRPDVKNALDVGCGVGFFSNYLSRLGLAVTAFDGRAENIVEARRRTPGVEFLVGDVQDVNIRALGRFDLVLCFGLLYHLENPFQAIRNLYALTEKVLIIESMITPGASPVATLVDEGVCEDQGLRYVAWIPTEASLTKMLYHAGFLRVYRPSELPDHEDFRETLIQRRRRTVLVAARSEVRSSLLRAVAPPRSYPPDLWRKPLGSFLLVVAELRRKARASLASAARLIGLVEQMKE